MNTSIAAFVLCAAGSSAFADVVILRNGGRLEGATSVSGDRLVVRLETGTVRIPLSDVAKIESSAVPADEYTALAAALAKGDVKGHLELADWCVETGLAKGERLELEAVIAADPNHAGARERLGYEKVGDKWLRGEELLIARGMVKFDGKWVRASEAERLATSRESLIAARREAEAKARAAQDARDAVATREEGSGTWGLISKAPARTARRVRSVRYTRGYRYYGHRGHAVPAAPAANGGTRPHETPGRSSKVGQGGSAGKSPVAPGRRVPRGALGSGRPCR